ncbi:CBS domain-containing protein [Allofrancisella frigidaquae]|uniref:CBS domain-containing protein n=1 Tax=Allofrancisella frigidaquae TaxID=1085644 RepID=A0A6M3HTZ1_9GAMM|nr:CBS domain-containing protein [Allofrancisella frigidaquae]QIV94557.1 CBS domain-containing protein [Allofrancisella frigidaquae]
MDLKDFKIIELSHFDTKAVSYFNDEASKLLYLESPAVNVFRDFKEHRALTITGDAPLQEVKQKLFDNHKDFILVINSDNQVTGTIGLHYLESTALQKTAQETGVKITELTADDIKLRISNVNAIPHSMIKDAKIGHILNTLMNTSYHHIVVYDEDSKNEQYIRGYFSFSHIKRKLGLEVYHSYQKDGVANISKGI